MGGDDYMWSLGEEGVVISRTPWVEGLRMCVVMVQRYGGICIIELPRL